MAGEQEASGTAASPGPAPLGSGETLESCGQATAEGGGRDPNTESKPRRGYWRELKAARVQLQSRAYKAREKQRLCHSEQASSLPQSPCPKAAMTSAT